MHITITATPLYGKAGPPSSHEGEPPAPLIPTESTEALRDARPTADWQHYEKTFLWPTSPGPSESGDRE